jgi:hypothetical protein
VRETVAKEQFKDSLSGSDMRLRIKQARPVNLYDAVRHAEELEAFHRSERRSTDNTNCMRTVSHAEHSNVKLKNDVEQLQKSVSEIKKL